MGEATVSGKVYSPQSMINHSGLTETQDRIHIPETKLEHILDSVQGYPHQIAR